MTVAAEPLAGRLGASGGKALLDFERQHGQSRVTAENLIIALALAASASPGFIAQIGLAVSCEQAIIKDSFTTIILR
jgi:hypothetical protein